MAVAVAFSVGETAAAEVLPPFPALLLLVKGAGVVVLLAVAVVVADLARRRGAMTVTCYILVNPRSFVTD